MKLYNQTRDYWRAARVVRLGTNDVRDVFAAHLVLIHLVDHGVTAELRKRARLLCLGYGISASGMTLLGGAA